MEKIHNQKIKNVAKETSRAIGSKMMTYFTAALGLVAGLAWNDAIKAAIEYLIPNTGTGMWAKLFYAILVTILVAVIFIYLEKRFPAEEK
jgi:hypothetical protein